MSLGVNKENYFPTGTEIVNGDNQITNFHFQLKKNKISELKEEILLVSPGLSGRQVKVHQIARYDE